MPIHDWTCADVGIFHDFRFGWVSEIRRTLNQQLLTDDHYAIIERLPDDRLLSLPPSLSAPERYAVKASWITLRRSRDNRPTSVVQIVSPGNKANWHALRSFVEKAVEFLEAGVHLLLLDLFPPGPRDPQGIHATVWSEITEAEFRLPPDKPLTLAAYAAGPDYRAFIEPAAVGDALPDMPLFLEPGLYVPVPLEATYRGAFDLVPTRWREVLERPPTPPG